MNQLNIKWFANEMYKFTFAQQTEYNLSKVWQMKADSMNRANLDWIASEYSIKLCTIFNLFTLFLNKLYHIFEVYIGIF